MRAIDSEFCNGLPVPKVLLTRLARFVGETDERVLPCDDVAAGFDADVAVACFEEALTELPLPICLALDFLCGF